MVLILSVLVEVFQMIRKIISLLLLFAVCVAFSPEPFFVSADTVPGRTAEILPEAVPPVSDPNAGPYITINTPYFTEIPCYSTLKIDYSTNAPKVTWESNDPSVLSVSSKGVVTAKKVQSSSVTITATACSSDGTPLTDGSGAIVSDSVDLYTDFIDVVDSDAYYYYPVYWAIGAGITNGYTDSSGKPTGYFGPNDTCTRAQVVTFIWRALGKPEPSSDAPTFKDVKSGEYYYKAVRWAADVGITGGYTDSSGKPTGKFGPNDKCTRAQIVTFLYRMACNLWNDSGEYNHDLEGTFTDVKKGAYYYNAVMWAVTYDVTNGYTDSHGNLTGKFGPNDKCTRGQVLTFMYRLD